MFDSKFSVIHIENVKNIGSLECLNIGLNLKNFERIIMSYLKIVPNRLIMSLLD